MQATTRLSVYEMEIIIDDISLHANNISFSTISGTHRKNKIRIK